jgi:hypothetical protein
MWIGTWLVAAAAATAIAGPAAGAKLYVVTVSESVVFGDNAEGVSGSPSATGADDPFSPFVKSNRLSLCWWRLCGVGCVSAPLHAATSFANGACSAEDSRGNARTATSALDQSGAYGADMRIEPTILAGILADLYAIFPNCTREHRHFWCSG